VSTLSIATDKTAYGPGDPIVVTLAVTGAPTTAPVHITGHVAMLDGTTGTVTGDATISAVYTLDPVTGYTIAADPGHPGVFTLTPAV
jgi:hypothetical protein